MVYSADIVIYDTNDQPVLIVEVKNKVGTSSDWAARMRHNILVHRSLPNARFFLLALPDRFYLWADTGNNPEVKKANYEINSMFLLKPYYEKSGTSPENLSHESFELMVFAWLQEILRVDTLSDVPQQVREWLIDSGLLNAIKEGYIASLVKI